MSEEYTYSCPNCQHHSKTDEKWDENIFEPRNGDSGVELTCPKCGETNLFLAVWSARNDPDPPLGVEKGVGI